MPSQRWPKPLQPGFNVRVYGLLIDHSKPRVLSTDRVLLCRELIFEKPLLKFPGGGLDFAESPARGLMREFREELGLKVQVGEFLFTSQKFHRSFFRPQQLITLYWRVYPQLADSRWRRWRQAEGSFLPRDLGVRFDSPEQILGFEWVPIRRLARIPITHPVDREFARHLTHWTGRGHK